MPSLIWSSMIVDDTSFSTGSRPARHSARDEVRDVVRRH